MQSLSQFVEMSGKQSWGKLGRNKQVYRIEAIGFVNTYTLHLINGHSVNSKSKEKSVLLVRQVIVKRACGRWVRLSTPYPLTALVSLVLSKSNIKIKS